MASHGISRTEYTAQSRDEHLRARELKKITEYNDLSARVQEKRSSNDYTPDALHLTSLLLKLNPEFYTIWNYRRQILLHTLLSPFTPPSPPTEESTKLEESHHSNLTTHLKDELQFLLPLLSSYPKCYWIWSHRLWTLHRSTLLLPVEAAAKFWQEELGLVGLMLRRDVRNFHGWMYRRFVVDSIENPKHAASPPAASLVEAEFAYTTTMVQNVGGLSNYSAWHNRSQLIPRLLVERNYDLQSRLNFLEDELELLQRLIATNPYDSSLWFYHRWLVYSNVTASKEAIAPVMERDLKVGMLSEEVDGLRELVGREGMQGCKYVLKALVEYTGLLQRVRREPGEDEDEDEDEDEADEEGEKEGMRGWLERLVEIDPMRAGRYRDLRLQVNV